jgi:hypothetical protein
MRINRSHISFKLKCDIEAWIFFCSFLYNSLHETSLKIYYAIHCKWSVIRGKSAKHVSTLFTLILFNCTLTTETFSWHFRFKKFILNIFFRNLKQRIIILIFTKFYNRFNQDIFMHIASILKAISDPEKIAIQ